METKLKGACAFEVEIQDQDEVKTTDRETRALLWPYSTVLEVDEAKARGLLTQAQLTRIHDFRAGVVSHPDVWIQEVDQYVQVTSQLGLGLGLGIGIGTVSYTHLTLPTKA